MFTILVGEIFKENKMDKELEKTVKQVAEYANIEKTKEAKIVMVYSIIGIIALIINQILMHIQLPGTFWIGFAKGVTAGLALCSMLFALLFATIPILLYLQFL